MTVEGAVTSYVLVRTDRDGTIHETADETFTDPGLARREAMRRNSRRHSLRRWWRVQDTYGQWVR